MKYYVVIFIALVNLTSTALGADDIYHFNNVEKEARYTALTNELRCLVCQNQTIAESNAGLANDLRREVYQQINLGQSNQQILTYLVNRYGDFILYRPPFNPATLLLWLGPLGLLLSGITYLIYYLRRHQLRE